MLSDVSPLISSSKPLRVALQALPDSEAGGARVGSGLPTSGREPPCQQKHLCWILVSQGSHSALAEGSNGRAAWVWLGRTQVWRKVPFHQRTWLFLFLALKIVSQAQRL